MHKYLSNQHHTFDPETIQILSDALDDAWRRVQASGAKLDGQADAARMMLAKHIVELAVKGERDESRLVQGALIQFRL